MSNLKKMGIWLDHNSAYLMAFNASPEQTQIIESGFTDPVKQERGLHSEHLLHTKENQADQQYYKNLIEQIKGYDEVLLFGPTNAKAELHNLIKADRKLEKINIEIKSTDKMSNNDMCIFTNKHFTEHQ